MKTLRKRLEDAVEACTEAEAELARLDEEVEALKREKDELRAKLDESGK